MDNPMIEVPVTSQAQEVYFFEVTPDILKETGVTKVEELVVLIQNGAVHPFDFDGDWDTCDSEVQHIYYEEARVC
jgi:hypothetical protein